MKSIHELREITRIYPRSVVRVSVGAALRSIIVDGTERAEFAAIVSAWLTDEEPSSDAPPLSEQTVDQIWRDLLRRAH